jgi:hypothetical protein
VKNLTSHIGYPIGIGTTLGGESTLEKLRKKSGNKKSYKFIELVCGGFLESLMFSCLLY